MRDEPEVLARQADATRALIRLRVPPELPLFAEHFPGQPILPAVVQLRWAWALAREHWPIGEVGDMSGLKFQRVVLPGLALDLELSWDTHGSALSFCYRGERGTYSAGRLHVAADG